MSADPRIQMARDLVRELAGDFKEGVNEVEPFLAGIASDIELLWTVPINRQDAFLERMRKQALALPELGRLKLVNTTREAFVGSIVAALRFAVRVAL